MVKIEYLESGEGIDNCFELLFYLKDYIPQEFYEKYKYVETVELYFYIRLLNYYGMFDRKKEHYHPYVDGCSYDCFWNGIPFKMEYDDWGIVSFAVDEHNLKYKKPIAEHLKAIIENKEYFGKLKLE